MLKSPTATVIKPYYEVLTLADQACVFDVLHDRPRVVALALGAGLRASELTGVKVGDAISDDDGTDWLRVAQVLAGGQITVDGQPFYNPGRCMV